MKDNEDYFIKIIPGIFEKYGRNTDGIYITSGLKIDSPRSLSPLFSPKWAEKTGDRKAPPISG